ncbi:MAG TPA: polyprenyl synthetase family protein [Firmicutes bacterium]|nr:polyprenyl synthetase family protein [Bacillales bacterium]HJA40529.1 polyprenyl synthetase family protein [Bacillota bacterium]
MHKLYFFAKKDLQNTERVLEKVLISENLVLNHAIQELLKAGGKRIRPLLVLICGYFSQKVPKNLSEVAATLEMIHMSSLVHDDVIDAAPVRRGVPTVYAQYGTKTSMYCGDFIFGRAIMLLSSIRNIHLDCILAKTIKAVCLGEIDQIRDKYDFDQSFRTYLRRIKRKTAILLSASCEMGACAAGASADIVWHVKMFGYYLGMSYQIIDDILDFTGDERTIGKPAGDDLRQGNITLPVLYALKYCPELSEEICSVSEDMPKAKLQPILEKICKSGGIEYAYQVSDSYYKLARAQWEFLPDGSAKDALWFIAQKIRKRNK